MRMQRTRGRGVRLAALVALVLTMALAGCGQAEDRSTSPGHGDTRKAPKHPTSLPKRLEPARQVQVVYFATDRARVRLDLAWYVDRFLWVGIAWAVGVLMLWVLARIVSDRFRAVVRALGILLILVLVGFGSVTAWDVHLKRQLAGRVGITYDDDRGTYDSAGLPLELGRMEVSVPPTHTEGVLERPDPLRGEFTEDPMKHFVIGTLEVLEGEAFFRDVRADAHDAEACLVFVHGYNCTFEDAAHRTAQIAWDLRFDGPAILYSWPSAGQVEDYHRDSENVKWTRRHLQAFLVRLVASVPGKRIHLVAHSMGNRALTEALLRMRLDTLEARERDARAGRAVQPAPDPFHQIVLAAPDIDADTFREDIAPAIRGDGRRITLYASSEDWALQQSERFNGAPRAGQAGAGGVVVVDGIETVDVSQVTGDHSYIGTNSFVLGCLRKILAGAPRPIVDDSRPDQPMREVRRQHPDGGSYWVLEVADD